MDRVRPATILIVVCIFSSSPYNTCERRNYRRSSKHPVIVIVIVAVPVIDFAKLEPRGRWRFPDSHRRIFHTLTAVVSAQPLHPSLFLSSCLSSKYQKIKYISSKTRLSVSFFSVKSSPTIERSPPRLSEPSPPREQRDLVVCFVSMTLWHPLTAATLRHSLFLPFPSGIIHTACLSVRQSVRVHASPRSTVKTFSFFFSLLSSDKSLNR